MFDQNRSVFAWNLRSDTQKSPTTIGLLFKREIAIHGALDFFSKDRYFDQTLYHICSLFWSPACTSVSEVRTHTHGHTQKKSQRLARKRTHPCVRTHTYTRTNLLSWYRSKFERTCSSVCVCLRLCEWGYRLDSVCVRVCVPVCVCSKYELTNVYVQRCIVYIYICIYIYISIYANIYIS